MSFQALVNSIPKDRTQLKGGKTQGYVQKTKENIAKTKYTPGQGKGVEYAAKFLEREEQEYFETRASGNQDLNSLDFSLLKSTMEEAEELTSVGTLPNIGELEREELTQVYQRYPFTPFTPSEQLEPIHNEREKLLQMINTNSVCIIEGPTGCGKSTQIPQFILDQHIKEQRHCNIVVTQPRRIAAISLAQRVCEERSWDVGQLVGYQVALDKNASEDTRLLYCTTGVLLEKLINTKNLLEYTHIVLDEIHEREEDMDFVILIVRRFLRTNSRNVKVILMSATMDTNRFVKYFEVLVGNKRCPAPFMKVGLRKFHIQTNYLDAVKSIVQKLPAITENEPNITQDGYNLIPSMIRAFNPLDKSDYEKKRSYNKKGAVLIFLPGLHQIETLHQLLEEEDKKDPHAFNLWLCPLHSSITRDEQEKVRRFAPVDRIYGEKRKVILSTNIAESSITIPDVKYVIDFCLTKHLVADPVTGFTSLQLAWASHTNCIQREGRAGRVQDGRVFRLVPRDFYEFKMPKESIPEMQRCPLELIVLKCKKLMEHECPLNLISCAMDPPDLGNYEKTILKLKEIGALRSTCTQRTQDGIQEEVYTLEDGDITHMGQVMASLPLDIHVSKLIILGHAFDVLDEAIIMGCAMATRNIFSEPFQQRLEAYKNKLIWSDTSESDAVAYLTAYNVWRKHTAHSKFERSVGNEEIWARRHSLQIKHLHEIAKQELDIKKRLKFLNIERIKSNAWTVAEKGLILKVVLAGAFYPHYFSRSHQISKTSEDAVKELNGRSHHNSVYFTNMPHPAPLYYDQVEKELAIKGVSETSCCFSDDSRKLIVSFSADSLRTQMIDEPALSGKILGPTEMPVYRALKLRQLNMSLPIKLIPPNRIQEELTKLSQDQNQVPENKLRIPLHKNIIALEISYVENAGTFYGHIQPKGKEFPLVHKTLNSYGALQPVSTKIRVNLPCVALFKDNDSNEFYRAIVKRVISNTMVEVYYIDFGNTSIVPLNELRELADEEDIERLKTVPPLALHCVMAEVGPNTWNSVRGQWSEEATSFVTNQFLMNENQIFLKIYSYCDGVASVRVHFRDPDYFVSDVPLNTRLLERKYAREREETYFSKVDHAKRKERKKSKGKDIDDDVNTNGVQSWSRNFEKNYMSLPTESNVSSCVSLKGPHSPLEMKLHSIVQCSTEKEVKVEWNSVNSVLLDSELEDPHERFLVAGSVSQSSDNKRLTLNHTTVLPNMHGFAHLMCLMFAPTVELRTDEAISRYTGALCGLGTNRGIPIFPGNDMEVNFDVEFIQADFIEINKFRFWMNKIVYSNASQKGDDLIVQCQQHIKQLATSLLSKIRRSTKVYRHPYKYSWGIIPQDVLSDPIPKQNRSDFDNLVYTLHNLIEINPRNDKLFIEKEIEKLEKLEASIKKGLNPKELHCSLCEVDFQYMNQLQFHMNSSYHKHLKEWLYGRARCHNKPQTVSCRVK